nr:uroporphyrinogen decarboxylase family protein [uncultured Acetobacterium sp.]
MLTKKENVLNFYNHKTMDRYVSYLDGIRYLLESEVHHERPPYKKSGKDWFGVDWEWDEALQTFVPDHRQKPVLDDICNWREVIQWPDLDMIDWENAVNTDKISEFADRDNFVFVVWFQEGPFERLHSLMGFEGALMAMVEEEDECKAFFQKWTEWRCKLIDYACKYYKPDVMQVSDDSGTTLSTFYSLNTWETLIKPCWAAMATQIKKNGVIPELHSCGKSQQFFTHLGDTDFEVLFIQSINDFELIRKSIGRPIGIIPTDFYIPLEIKALANGIIVKEVRDYLYDFVKKNIETSNNDFFMLLFPPFTQLGDVPEDKVLTTTADVMACAFEWNIAQEEEFTKLVQQRNAEISANN